MVRFSSLSALGMLVIPDLSAAGALAAGALVDGAPHTLRPQIALRWLFRLFENPFALLFLNAHKH